MPVLNEARIRSDPPKHKPYKLFDERALFLVVSPSGGRLWRFRYRLGGGETARPGRMPRRVIEACPRESDDARKLVADDVDPNAKRQGDTFEAIRGEWLTLQRASWWQ
ncbi:MAG: Arm DNA-binding domain-containing protein [Acidobacteriota bacterium]|nr:Arm DNA-binding domain-containing protein [Acidobacteriota bacterium]